MGSRAAVECRWLWGTGERKGDLSERYPLRRRASQGCPGILTLQPTVSSGAHRGPARATPQMLGPGPPLLRQAFGCRPAGGTPLGMWFSVLHEEP